jgi:hypothetical protein
MAAFLKTDNVIGIVSVILVTCFDFPKSGLKA